MKEEKNYEELKFKKLIDLSSFEGLLKFGLALVQIEEKQTLIDKLGNEQDCLVYLVTYNVKNNKMIFGLTIKYNEKTNQDEIKVYSIKKQDNNYVLVGNVGSLGEDLEIKIINKYLENKAKTDL